MRRCLSCGSIDPTPTVFKQQTATRERTFLEMVCSSGIAFKRHRHHAIATALEHTHDRTRACERERMRT